MTRPGRAGVAPALPPLVVCRKAWSPLSPVPPSSLGAPGFPTVPPRPPRGGARPRTPLQAPLNLQHVFPAMSTSRGVWGFLMGTSAN